MLVGYHTVEQELLRRIVRARKNNSIAIIFALPILWFMANDAINGEWEMSFGMSLFLFFISQVALIFVPNINNAIKIYFNAYCPNCNNLVERSQFIGAKVPKRCTKCGLSVAAFNK